MTIPRWCERCGRKPEAYKQRRWCYDCKRGNKGWPRPCRRCGSTGNYWAGGLCRRCHQYAPQLPESCPDCLAWGTWRIDKWLCGSCASWRFRYPARLTCISCGAHRNVNDHKACRLCWRQAKAQQPHLGRGLRGPLNLLGANRYGQQLDLANMASPKNGYRPHKRVRRPGPPVEDQRTEPELPGQLALFARDRIAEAASTYGVPDPPNVWLARELDTAIREHARRYGWPAETIRVTRIAMRVLLGIHAITATPIQATQVQHLVAYGLRVRPVFAVLDELGVLDDDRTAAVDAWFAKRIEDLPAQMADELRTWFQVLRHGSTTPPRSRPRHPETIKSRLRWALPTLRAWAAEGHESLREIARPDVLAVLPAGGTPRATIGGALRSIFATLKGHKVTFTNPMARISVGNFTRRTPMLLEDGQLRRALTSPHPAGAALAALVIFHGLAPDELRDLMLTDVRDGRLHLSNRVVSMAEMVKQRLATYLTYRRQRWPNTVNPHFFIHERSATGTEPVKHYWVNGRLGMPARALRQHRIVDEVQATAGDLRRICDFFGVTMATAQHYATTLNHPGLINMPDTDAAGSSATEGLD